jgi:hypothetical protein
MTVLSRRTALKTIGATGLLVVTGVGTATAQDEVAMVRVAHLSPNTPEVDVIVDDSTRAFTDASFGDVTDYAELPAGEYNVKVVPAGAPPESAFIDADLTLDADTAYTVAAIGENRGQLAPLVLVDDNSDPDSGDAKLRVVHASPDAPAVDVTANGGDVTLVDGLAFGEASDYVEVPADTYDVEVRADTESNDGTVVLEISDLEIPDGAVITAYAVGFVGGRSPEFSVFTTVDN